MENYLVSEIGFSVYSCARKLMEDERDQVEMVIVNEQMRMHEELLNKLNKEFPDYKIEIINH